MPPALILFGHGARDPEWAAPLLRIQLALRASHPEARVALAFLEFVEPALEQCVAGLRAEGFREFMILPVFIARSGHLKRDLAVAVDALRQRYSDSVFAVAPAVGEDPRVIAAMATCAGALIDQGTPPLPPG